MGIHGAEGSGPRRYPKHENKTSPRELHRDPCCGSRISMVPLTQLTLRRIGASRSPQLTVQQRLSTGAQRRGGGADRRVRAAGRFAAAARRASSPGSLKPVRFGTASVSGTVSISKTNRLECIMAALNSKCPVMCFAQHNDKARQIKPIPATTVNHTT